MTTSTPRQPNRQPAGVPTGGQFAPDARGRASFALDEFGIDAPTVSETMGHHLDGASVADDGHHDGDGVSTEPWSEEPDGSNSGWNDMPGHESFRHDDGLLIRARADHHAERGEWEMLDNETGQRLACGFGGTVYDAKLGAEAAIAKVRPDYGWAGNDRDDSISGQVGHFIVVADENDSGASWVVYDNDHREIVAESEDDCGSRALAQVAVVARARELLDESRSRTAALAADPTNPWNATVAPSAAPSKPVDPLMVPVDRAAWATWTTPQALAAAADFERLGFDSRTASEWYARGFDADESYRWDKQARIADSLTAARWRDSGFEPTDARAWDGNGFTIPEAQFWSGHGFDGEQARDWIASGKPVPSAPDEDHHAPIGT